MLLERAHVGCKALPNAREVQQLLHRWVEDHHRRAADEVAGFAAVVAPVRHTVLHDGRRQVCIVSTWPEGSPELERAVHAVVESLELR